MSTDLVWSIAIVWSKCLIYVSVAMVMGGFFIECLVKDSIAFKKTMIRYIRTGGIMGLCVVSLDFLMQVGRLAENGLLGMFDSTLMSILWSGNQGINLKIRANSFLFILALTMLFSMLDWRKPWVYILRLLMLLCIVVLGYSFTLTGHAVNTPSLIQVAIILHVIVGLTWVGCLIPLLKAPDNHSIQDLQKLMVRFGYWAIGPVILLLVFGMLIAYQLLDGDSSRQAGLYDHVLSLKFVLVIFILLLAVYHKLSLVPKLTTTQAKRRLVTSISIELAIGVCILLITSGVSSVISPV